MALSSVALKKLVSSNLLPKSLRTTRQAIPAAQYSASRLFNTHTVAEFDGDNAIAADLLAARKSFFDAILKSNISTSRPDEFAPKTFSGLCRGMYAREAAKETEYALHLRMELPGLGIENVKIVVEQNTLIIKGESVEKYSGEEDNSIRRYCSRIDLSDKVYDIDQIKAEMKNGVLRVVVPKVKDEERSDVFHVHVEYKKSNAGSTESNSIPYSFF